ncbi:MAG: phosphodiester glycosidase family protein [Clostridiales bacterium]|nr:phosphodiester glycosidase family protein [Clostridiales bacterium]
MRTLNSSKKFFAVLLSFAMLFTVIAPISALAEISFDTSKLGSNMYLTSQTDYTVAPGITEKHITTNNSSGSNQNQGFAIEVDLSNPTTSIISSYKDQNASSWGMQTVRDQAAAAESKLGVNVVAGVNGDYYNMSTGAPTGSLVLQGVTYNTNDNWNYFAILKDGTAVIGSGKADTDNMISCVGGPTILVKDGVKSSSILSNTAALPRTAVGIKADGSVVFLVVDGRQAPTSCGVTYSELADMMIALGCVDALNLDGGGSSTMLSQHEGSDELVCRNSPSDGSERTVSTAILICSSATATGVFDHASLSPNNELYTPGSAVTFTAEGVDSAGYAASLPADGYFALEDTSYGSITTDGVFTSNGTIGTVTVNYISGGVICGTTTIEIREPDEISFTNEEISLGFEAESTLGLSVKYKTIDMNYKEGDIVWTMSDETMGSFSGNTFIASDFASVTGTITATSAYDSSISGSITAIIGKLPSVIWDFENPDDYIFAYAQCDPSGGKVVAYGSDYVDGVTTMLNLNYGRNSIVESEVVDVDTGKVRMGSYALKISYDFTNVATDVIEGACIGAVVDSESTEGTPTAVGFWMYCPEGTPNFWVRMRLRDGNGTVQTVNFNESGTSAALGGIDWTGWKYLEADLTGLQGPFSFNAGETIRIMWVPGSSNGFYSYAGVDESGNKIFNSVAHADCKGYIYIDNVQFVYGSNTDDVNNPVIDTIEVGDLNSETVNIGSSTTVNANEIAIQTTFHDFGSGDGESDKYATDINFESCRVYIDGKDVTEDCIVLTGDYTIKYYTTLANGLHSIQVVIRDSFNNETSETRYFTVAGEENLPTAKVEAVTADCTLGSDYKLALSSNEIGLIESVTAQIRLDADLVPTADDITVEYADGFEGSFTYDESTGTMTITVTKQDGAEVASTGGFDALAYITTTIPVSTAEGKSFTYRVLEGSIVFSDETITTDTFASASVSTAITAAYSVYTEVSYIGGKTVIHVENADGTAAAGVNVYSVDGTLLGTTYSNGLLACYNFTSEVQNFTIYANNGDDYSFRYTSQTYAVAGDSSGIPYYVLANAAEDGDTSKTITWLSNPLVSDETATVLYAAKADYEAGGMSSLMSASGTSKVIAFGGSTDINSNYAVRTNTVTLTGLDENTEYVYFVGDGTIISSAKSFKTSMSGADTSFFVFGDIQAEDTSNVASLLNAMANDGVSYDFGIQTGDSVEQASLYDDWSDILDVFSDEDLADQTLIHVLGNHEYMGDEYAAAANAIYGTADDKYYSVEYGNIYVAVVSYYTNSEAYYQEVMDWLVEDASASDALWKIVAIHVPAYNTNTTDSHDFLTENFPTACEEAGIDFVFSGHDHSYARTLPMTGGEVDEDNGVVYFICGSSGEKSYSVTNTPEYNFAIATNDYSGIYLSVTATDSMFTVTTYDVVDGVGQLIDSYTKTSDSTCMTDGHSYVFHEDGVYVTCSVCGYTTELPSDFTGFVNDSDGSLMYYIAGNKQTGWLANGTDYYYFDENGHAITGTLEEDGHTYTFGEDGKMTKGSLELQSNGRYCYYIAGSKQRGWVEIEGLLYYFNRSNGKFDTMSGTVTINNNTSIDLVYTFSEEGYLLEGAWNETEYGIQYYWGASPVSGLYTIGDDLYYFDPSNNNCMATGTVTIDGTAYTFAPDGKFAYYGTCVERKYIETSTLTCTTDGYELYEDTLDDGTTVEVYAYYEAASGHDVPDGSFVCDICGLPVGSLICDFLCKLVEFFNKIAVFLSELF